MAKNVIRLTESDLQNIIKESVNNILSELDWRTYDHFEKLANDKSKNASSTPAARYRANQRDAFSKAKIKRQEDMYDGVSEYNYAEPHRFPNRAITRDGKTTYDRLFNPINGKTKSLSDRKQIRGAAEIDANKQGKDKWDDVNKKWIKGNID